MVIKKVLITIPALLLAVACVTININFPAAQASEIADKIVDDIYSGNKRPEQPKENPDSTDRASATPLWIVLLNGISTPAYAADVDASSPQVRRIQAQLKKRNSALLPFYQNGAIGLTAQGLLTVRDKKAAPLKARGKLKKLVNAENANRLALYKAIAQASGHPEWSGRMQNTFAKKWIENAQSGWWYQNASGQWQQK